MHLIRKVLYELKFVFHSHVQLSHKSSFKVIEHVSLLQITLFQKAMFRTAKRRKTRVDHISHDYYFILPSNFVDIPTDNLQQETYVSAA